jgi:peroxiredoxin
MFSLFLLSLTACPGLETPTAAVGRPAPAFALKDLDGRTVKLADFADRIVVLDFWATWCGPCRESTAEFEKLHQKHKDSGVVVIGISMDVGAGAVENVRKFAKESDLSYLKLMDNGTASRAYVVTKVPVTYILDKNHIVTKIFPGYLKGLGGKIEQEIEKLK